MTNNLAGSYSRDYARKQLSIYCIKFAYNNKGNALEKAYLQFIFDIHIDTHYKKKQHKQIH